MFRSFVFCILVLASACSQNLTSSKDYQKSNFKAKNAIIGGTYVPENSTIAASTVGIYDTENESACTGTLLTETVVITAAHCLATGAKNLRIVFGSELSATLNAREVDVQRERVLRAKAIRIHSQYEDSATKTTDLHDIALIQLEGVIPAGYRPATQLQNADLLKKGALVTMAGFGITLVQATNINEKKFPNLEKAIENGDIVCDQPEVGEKQHCYKIEFKGDDDLRMTNAPIESEDPGAKSEIILDESNGHGTCVGDSGGPAFLQLDGVYYYFGITSRGSYACDGYGVYTNILYYADWIAENLRSFDQPMNPHAKQLVDEKNK